MNERDTKKQHPKSQEESKNIVCIGEESYLNELMLNSKSMQRLQDFIMNLDGRGS
jgi:hypothetical protein